MKTENDLGDMLLNRYQNLNAIRPEQKVTIYLTLDFKQITSIDEKSQIMTSSSYLITTWIDPRLTWDPKDYNSITKIVVKANKIWVPDLVITNSASDEVFLKINEKHNAMIMSDGFVYIAFNLNSLKTRCEIETFKFPFDE